MNDESPLIRQWILLKTLAERKYGATVKELAREAGVSIQTIRRDLETFKTAGFPLREVVGEFGRKKWNLDSAKPPAELNFTWEEAAALYLGRRLLDPLMGTIFCQAAREAFKKIQAVLDPIPRQYLDKFGTIFCQTMVGTHDYSKKADLIDALMQAIEDSQAVSLTYQALQATEPVTYTVWPYGLAYHRGSLFKRWIMSFGKQACVLEPDQLRIDIATELRFMTEAYDDTPKRRLIPTRMRAAGALARTRAEV